MRVHSCLWKPHVSCRVNTQSNAFFSILATAAVAIHRIQYFGTFIPNRLWFQVHRLRGRLWVCVCTSVGVCVCVYVCEVFKRVYYVCEAKAEWTTQMSNRMRIFSLCDVTPRRWAPDAVSVQPLRPYLVSASHAGWSV